MRTLADLKTFSSKDEMMALLLQRLQGISGVEHVGTGSAAVLISGAPAGIYSVVLVVEAATSNTVTLRVTSGVSDLGATEFDKNVPTDLGVVDSSLAGIFITPSDEAGEFIVTETYTFSTTTPAFPTTSWQSGSVPRNFLEAESEVLSDLHRLLSDIADGGFLDLASGDWLTRLARYAYGLTRTLATATRGFLSLTNPDGADAQEIAAGDLTFLSDAGLRYQNIAAATLAAGPSVLALEVQAVETGAKYNASAGTIRTMVTPLPGVTATNALNWITFQGTDDESDRLLRQRCRDMWASLGAPGATEAVYRLWARTSTSQVTRVQAKPTGPESPGEVTIKVAGPAGGVSGGVVAIVQAYIDVRTPLCTIPAVSSAANTSVPILGTVYVYGGAAGEAAARAVIEPGILALMADVDIGGVFYISDLVDLIHDMAGVRNFATVMTDIQLADGAVPVADITDLTYVQV